VSRTEINLPGRFNFSTVVPIRIGDVNSGHHLDHASMVRLIQEARAQFLSSLGLSEQYDVNSGLGFIIADLSIVYKKQVSYGQRLRIEVGSADFTQKGFDILYLVSEEHSGAEVARAKTGIVEFDYHRQQAIPLPDIVKKKLTA
jgi:acyl-CoA thioester hydrolase